MAEMLSLCREPQTKTRIMYRTNLSYAGVERYLHQLLTLRLLEAHRSIAKYSTTERGIEFLDRWAQLNHLISPMIECAN